MVREFWSGAPSTLDGNSQDWRYIPVRRTAIFLERSIQEGMENYIFSANDASTWGAVKAMIESFLTSIWKEGGLQGASSSDAFSVAVGLGSSMTSDDILNGWLRVSVKVALVRPAEFIVLNFEQQQADS
ncbi:phage tail sheath C-terminal domain-containing protein [Thalassolituus hydrocarboniclasticus]|uniref:phage tail sheath C-terminal domain-containing protein n=1 Tax=Thalassolituus hydrocarboniclasticus TaxID=2742796 RepID=UPI0021B52549|nr:phage tail sheath C-terminal domain-containing protein [Thalassolituus hydrocarboniclasticus]